MSPVRRIALSAGVVAVAVLGASSSAHAASFAVVDAAGSLKQNKDATSALKTATGVYEVVFGRDVAGCVSMATIAVPAFGIALTSPGASPNSVHVETQTASPPSGTAIDLPFNVTVHCAGDGLWAAVNAGVFERKSDPAITITGVTIPTVFFPQDMTACAAIITGTGPRPGPLVTHHGHDGGATSVTVTLKNMGYGNGNFSRFQIAAFCSPSAYWGVVSHDGSLVRGANVVSASRVGAGLYEVVFNRDVSACAPVAVHGYAGVSGDVLFVPPLIAVGRSVGNTNAVRVETRVAPFTDPATPFIDKPFHLALECPPLPPQPQPQPPPPPAPPPPLPPPPPPPPPSTLDARVKLQVRVFPRQVQVLSMKVVNVERGSRVSIRCVRGCSLKRATIVRGRTQSLTALFSTRRIPLGSVLEVRVTKPGTVGRYFRYTFTPKEVRSTECRIALNGKLTRCSSA